MKISLLGPTNMKKLAKLTEQSEEDLQRIAEHIGAILAKGGHELIVVFNYSGMLKLIGDSYKNHGGMLHMLYTKNDYDWDTELYMKNLAEADVTSEKESWHDMLLSLVKDSEIVLCAGLSAGGLAELAYMNGIIRNRRVR